MNIEVYQIDSSTPLPPERGQLPLDQLEVGESFLFPLEERKKVQSLASNIKARNGKLFTVRKQDDLIGRVWRKI